uniref:RRM domain-containing protein n=1 Tax=Macrostomum lignano TaxID=282301 RepID=A0A1I8IBC6_9PLAT
MSTEAEPAADGNNSAQATDKPVKQASTTDASAPKKGSNYSGDNNSEAVNSNDNEATATEKESIVAKLNSDRGISAELANLLAELVVSPNKIFSLDDFDERATNAVKDLDAEFLRSVVDELLVKDYTNISNKSACLCGLVKQMKLKRQQQQLGDPADAIDVVPPPPVALRRRPALRQPEQLLVRRLHQVTVGQRRLGPPIGAEELKDSSQCEIFVGKLPKDMYEDRIYQMFRPVGPIYDIRVMVDPPTGMGRGFCFVCYTSKQDASKAVNLATPNLRLFVGNIPKTLDRAKLMDDFSRVLDGVVDVIVYGSADDPRKKNRGFCFLEFDKHSSASAARRKLMKYPRVWSSDVWVDWADPLDEPDPDVMAKVRVLYVKSLTMDVTEDKLQEAFSVYGPLERVKKVKDYGFVHFEEREDALRAMEKLDGTSIGNSGPLSVTLAKPVSERAKQRKEERRMRNTGMPPMPPPAASAYPHHHPQAAYQPGFYSQHQSQHHPGYHGIPPAGAPWAASGGYGPSSNAHHQQQQQQAYAPTGTPGDQSTWSVPGDQQLYYQHLPAMPYQPPYPHQLASPPPPPPPPFQQQQQAQPPQMMQHPVPPTGRLQRGGRAYSQSQLPLQQQQQQQAPMPSMRGHRGGGRPPYGRNGGRGGLGSNSRPPAPLPQQQQQQRLLTRILNATFAV